MDSDSTYDPDNKPNIDILSSSLLLPSRVNSDLFDQHIECITPSPYCKGYNSKHGYHDDTTLNSNCPAVDHWSKCCLTQTLHKEDDEDPPPGTTGGW